MQAGEFIKEDTPVITLVQMDPLKLSTAVQERYAGAIHPHMPVQFSVESFPGEIFHGEIVSVSPAVDQQTRTFPIEAELPNPDYRLKPGFFAKGVILTQIDDNVLAVPEDAVSTLAGVSTVYVIENGKVRPQQVTLGVRQKALVEIVDGLKGDERLATTNLNLLAAGVPVVEARGQGNNAVVDGKPRARKIHDHLPRQRQSPGLRHHAHGGHRRDGLVFLSPARPRPDAEDRSAHRERVGVAARRQRRRDRNGNHQAPSKRPSTPSTASTSCAPALTRAPLASRSRSCWSGTSKAPCRTFATKVATVVRNFPRDTLPPVIQKIDPDAAPILTLVVSGSRSAKELTEIADKQIKQVLETVKDVGAITFIGDRHREIDLLLNADRLNAYGLTVDQVQQAVQRQDVEIPGGSFVSGPAEISLRTMGRIQNVDDFNRIIVSSRSGSVVTFGDVGRVVDTVQEIRSAARLDGQPAISLLIQKQSGTNTVDVVDNVLKRLDVIRRTLPSDMRVQPIRDQSRFIRRSFEDIKLHLFLGGLLASFVVFLFIRNLKVTLIAALAIPTSIIGTFTVMKAFGFTLNNMTMLALSLATGIVIDDAIVVLENVFRLRRREGRDAARGGHQGHRGDRPRRHGDDAVARRDLPAGGVHDRPGGPVFLQLRHHVGRGHSDLDAGVLHADAHALLALAEEVGRRASADAIEVARFLRLDGSPLWPHARVGAGPPAGDGCHRGRRDAVGGAALSARRQGARA